MKIRMKKNLTGFALAGLMAISAVTPAFAKANQGEYLYENKYLWTIPTDSFTWDTYYSLYDHHKGMGRDAYDKTAYSIDDIVNSPLGEGMVENVANFLIYPDENDPAVYQYWEELGIKKELHDGDDQDRKWSSFVPLSAYEEENADKKYPVLFVFHGNNNPIYFIESWGYPNLVAEEEFICVMPWARNGGKTSDENDGAFLTEEVDRILETLRADYPIDESRIYATGFSLGGRSTVNQLMKHPNLFAAVGVGGQHTYGVSIVDEEWAALKETPMITMAGTCDRNNHFPYGQKGAGQIEGLNRWLALNGIDDSFTEEECIDIADHSPYVAERKLGLTSDNTCIQYYDGTQYYTANWYNDDGVNMVQAIAIEGMPHWLTGAFPKLVWNFMKQYARDTETGELIVLNQDNELQLTPETIDYNKEGTFIQSFTTDTTVGGDILINLKASTDIKSFVIKDEKGSTMDSIATEFNHGEDGYDNWVIRTSVSEAGRRVLTLVPTSDKYGEKDGLKFPVVVSEIK